MLKRIRSAQTTVAVATGALLVAGTAGFTVLTAVPAHAAVAYAAPKCAALAKTKQKYVNRAHDAYVRAKKYQKNGDGAKARQWMATYRKYQRQAADADRAYKRCLLG